MSTGSCDWLQKKLNRLIDDGIVRPGELDNVTLDALEGASFSARSTAFFKSGNSIHVVCKLC